MERRQVLLLFTAAFFLLEEAGPLGHGLSRLIGLLTLGALIFARARGGAGDSGPAAAGGRGDPHPQTWWTAASWTVAIGMVLLAPLTFRPLALALIAAGLSGTVHAGDRARAPAAGLALGAAVAALLLLLVDSNSLAWLALQGVAIETSRLGGTLVGRPSLLGATYLDLRFALFLAVCLAAASASRGRRRPLAAVLPVTGVAASALAFAVFAALLPDLYAAAARALAPAGKPPNAAFWGPVLANLPILGLPFYLPNVLWLPSGSASRAALPGALPAEPTAPNASRPPLVGAANALALGALALGVALLPPLGRGRGPARTGAVLLYEHGFLNWDRPRYGLYGEYSAGMFGNLPLTLASLGIPARVVPALGEEALGGAAAVVLVNLERPIPAAELDALWRFVRRGGGLLVLGDHTFLKQDGRNWLNETLAPAHIRYRFDSAQFFIGGWLHSYHYRPHPTTVGLRDDRNQPGIVVGASLELRPPAAPLIVGRYGFSDAGDPGAAREGHIGDLLPAAGEPVGDLVLAASERIGDGRLLVIGDTSGFTNLIGARSHRFLARVFRWLVRTGEAGGDPWRETLSLLCALGALVLLFAGRLGAAPSATLSARAAALALLPAFVLPVAMLKTEAAPLDVPPRGPIAYVDESHAERFSPDGWRDHGIIGLYLNLYRAGYLALAMDEFDPARLAAARLIVLVAPAAPFGARERATLRAFVEDGGWLLACVGYEERGGLAELLSGYGIEIEGTPLGGARSTTADGDSVTFKKAWPVRAAEATTLASAATFPLVVRRDVGRGAVVVIGDPALLLNANLEHGDHAHDQTIAFLRWLFEKHLPPGPPIGASVMADGPGRGRHGRAAPTGGVAVR